MAWVLAVYGGVCLRYDFKLHYLFTWGTFAAAALVAAAQLVVGSFRGPYAVHHRLGSAEEIADLARTVVISAALLGVLTLVVYPPPVPTSTPITSGTLALLVMFTMRFVRRAWWTRRARRRHGMRRAVVFGAGQSGERLIKGLLADRASRIVPVALLDDDPAKSRLRIEGIRVRGTRSQVAEVVEAVGADLLIVAASRVDPQVMRKLSEAAALADLDVKVLPSLQEMVGPGALGGFAPTAHDLRDLDLADLLGRRPVHLELDLIAAAIAGRRVLVTGAGGSIGAELCRQIARFEPAKLCLLDRDESGLHGTQMSLSGRALLDSDEVILADIRDARTVHRVMQDVRPDLVFHAAALKHLPLLERFPAEAWQTNVVGTLNVLTAAAACGVGTFVNISTDKAADPTSVLGLSKRLTEYLTAHFARHAQGRYVSVRFGNVLGSRGSVIHSFTAQIEQGGPVTVTDPAVMRYFMLIPEACQLVLQATAIGRDGDVMVLEMGEQVRILDVARTMIQISGRDDVAIEFTGLRPGEKLQEDLFSESEEGQPTAHPLITSVRVPEVSPAQVRGALPPDAPVADELLVAWMRQALTGARGGDSVQVGG
ncbi:MAG: polysaccharide biosynthesis protein [Austwickia sp.]|nr:polysaccharide biosynthesis protein [Austwickia sp.]MBK8436840.1 polysaccharide biosynthesis protein [Austwickia sp.]MBK9100468.1 polysaccharide biosynthesis protein [Austwickia sp.]